MYKSSTPQDATLYFSGATTYSGNGAVTWAVTGLAYIDTFGLSTMTLQIVGAHTSTMTFQESNDLVTWVSAPLQSESTVPLAENTSVTNGQGLYGWQPRARYFRINVSAYTSSPTLYVYGKAGTTPPATQPTVAILEAGTASIGTVNIGNTANTTPILANPNTDYPSGATPITNSSGNVANASAVATLAGTSAKTTYITGFEVTAGGATAGALVTVTVVGTISGTLSYTFATPTGATIGASPLIVEFSTPIPASTTNTAIVVTLPALGSGNTNATVVAHGYQL